MQQHITNLILELLQDKTDEESNFLTNEAVITNNHLHDLRQQVPDLVTKIMNLMEYGKK